MIEKIPLGNHLRPVQKWSSYLIFKSIYAKVFLLITFFLSLSSFNWNTNDKVEPEKSIIKAAPTYVFNPKLNIGLMNKTYVGGDFSLDFVAAAPGTYNHTTGGGAFDDRTIGKTADVVESLEGGDFTCGDNVTFLTELTVAQNAVGSQTIQLDYSFLAASTGQPGVALYPITYVGINYGVVSGGDGTGGTDAAIHDDGGSTATIVNGPATGTLNGTLFKKPATTTATVEITDLEAGEVVIVRIDIKIACQIPSSPTGNLQADIAAGRIVDPVFNKREATISLGQQTVPFKNVNLIGQGDCLLDNNTSTCVGTILNYTAQTSVTSPTYTWSLSGDAVFVDANGATITDPGNVATVRVKATSGTTGSFTLQVVVTATQHTPATCTDVVTVNAVPDAPAVSATITCDATTFSITVGSTAKPIKLGAIYTVTDKCGAAITGISPASPYTATSTDVTANAITFSNIPVGSGYKVTVSENGCTSAATSCGTCTTSGATTSIQATDRIEPAETINAQIESQTKVLAMPNPFFNKIKFALESDISGQGTLEIYNMLGQKVKTIYQGYIKKGQMQNVEYNVPNAQRANLIYIFRVGDRSVTGKLLGIK